MNIQIIFLGVFGVFIFILKACVESQKKAFEKKKNQSANKTIYNNFIVQHE